MSDQIKEGDIVQLKSGGPKMTVESVNRKNEVKCCFFKEDDAQWVSYPSHVLKKVES